jgi:hypothetical protein
LLGPSSTPVAWSFDADHTTAYSDMWQKKWDYYQQCIPEDYMVQVERMSAADIKARAVWLVSNECILPGLSSWLIAGFRRMT